MCSFQNTARRSYMFQVHTSDGNLWSDLHQAMLHSFRLMEGSSGLLEGVGMLTWS